MARLPTTTRIAPLDPAVVDHPQPRRGGVDEDVAPVRPGRDRPRPLDIGLDQPLVISGAAVERGDRWRHRRCRSARGRGRAGIRAAPRRGPPGPRPSRRRSRSGRGMAGSGTCGSARPARAIGGEPAAKAVIDRVDLRDRRRDGPRAMARRRPPRARRAPAAPRARGRDRYSASPTSAGGARCAAGIIGIGLAEQQIGAGQLMRVAALAPRRRRGAARAGAVAPSMASSCAASGLSAVALPPRAGESPRSR